MGVLTIDWLTLQFLGDVGSTTLVIIFVLAILTGRLRPQSAIKELRDVMNARVAEANAQYNKALEMIGLWEKAYNTAESARANQAKAMEDMASVVKAVQSVYSSQDSGGGRSNDVPPKA